MSKFITLFLDLIYWVAGILGVLMALVSAWLIFNDPDHKD